MYLTRDFLPFENSNWRTNVWEMVYNPIYVNIWKSNVRANKCLGKARVFVFSIFYQIRSPQLDRYFPYFTIVQAQSYPQKNKSYPQNQNPCV